MLVSLVTSNGFQDFDEGYVVITALFGGFFSAVAAAIYASQVANMPVDEKRYPKAALVAKKIAEGSRAFLKAEYTILTVFVIIIAAILCALAWQKAIIFIVGALLSATTGYLGMSIATLANIRTTIACEGPNGLNNGLRVAFKSGAVMGLSVVAFVILGVSIMYVIFVQDSEGEALNNLSAFAFGGSLIALFARVGGGIYTKAADVGADLVGKVESGLNEDDPNNPATIADNVGDNVGDVAGMGADLFESYAGSIIAAATLGHEKYGFRGVALPFWIAGLAALASIVGTLLVRTSQGAKSDEEMRNIGDMTEEEKFKHDREQAEHNEKVLESLLGSIRFGIYSASFLVLITSMISVMFCFGAENSEAWELFACVVLGLVMGNLIGYFTEYSTSYTYWPTQSIAFKSDTGPATVVIQGLGVGMLSTVPPAVFIVVTIIAASELSGVYGVAIAAVGVLSTLGVTLATDAYGPVADNAGGIAEMAGDEIPEQVRETTDALDALGNTTAATGKGFAIGSAVLTALALTNAFADEVGINITDSSLLSSVVLSGLLIGSLMPFVFAALTMLSVGKAAESIMWEVRRQIHDEKILEGGIADHTRCVDISTNASLREMIAPGTLAVVMPLIIGFVLGAQGLIGMLSGAIATGFLLAVTMANSGGAWDNAKKWVEKGNLSTPGVFKGKNTLNHAAVVVGDTIGDPFKDTSGPALNILIKLMSVVSLVIASEIPEKAWDPEKWWIGLVVFVIIAVLGVGFYIWLSKQTEQELKLRDAIIGAREKRNANPSEEELLTEP